MQSRCLECSKPGCTLKCPTCCALGLGNSFFCDKVCFKKGWKQHKKSHDPNSIPIAKEGQVVVCQLSAILFPYFNVSQIDRFSSLLESNLYILDGKPRKDFFRMWDDIRMKHPNFKGGTIISFPIHVNVKIAGGVEQPQEKFRGIVGPSDALMEFLGEKGIKVEKGVEFQSLVPWSDPKEWTVGWTFNRKLTIVKIG